MTKVVFFGASSVEGTGTSSPERRFSTRVSQAMGWEEINQGIGGTTVVGRDDAGQVIDENSGIGRLPDVLDAEPDFVFIHFGANDFAKSLPLGDADEFRQGTYYWDWDTMLRGLLDELEPQQVILCTCQYRRDAETPNALGHTLNDYNQVVLQMGEKYQLQTLDAFHDAGIDASNFDSLCADDAHLNDTGCERLSAFISAHLRP